MTPADVLDAAADLLERDGWCQGREVSGTGERCTLAALAGVAGWHDDMSARRALRRAIDEQVVRWNDAPHQTAENVIATLRRVAADLRAES